MTIKKAIKVIEQRIDKPHLNWNAEDFKALKLGVEALKARKTRQEHLTPLLRELLPGETKE